MHYRITVRYGADRPRYHTFELEASELTEALRAAADELPEEVARSGDLLEIRPGVMPEDREYIGERE